MITLKYKITGVRPMLLHNVNSMTLKKPTSVSAEDWEAGDEAFNAKCYWDEDRLIIPDRVWKGHLVTTAKKAMTQGIKPPKGKTYTDLVKALVFPNPMYLDMKTTKLNRETQFVTVQRSKVMRVWPKLDDWSGTLELIVGDEKMLPKEAITTLLEFGGKLVGLGDYRPDYGRYSPVMC